MTAKEAKEIRDLVVEAIASHDFKRLYENRHTIEVYLNNMVTMAESGDREKAIMAEVTRLIPLRSQELADALGSIEKALCDVMAGTGTEESPKAEERVPSRFRTLDGPSCSGSCGEGCEEAEEKGCMFEYIQDLEEEAKKATTGVPVVKYLVAEHDLMKKTEECAKLRTENYNLKLKVFTLGGVL